MRLHMMAVLTAAILTACHDSPVSTTEQISEPTLELSGNRAPRSSATPIVASMPLERRALMDSIIRAVPGENQSTAAQILSSSMSRMRAPDNPRLQALLDRFYAATPTAAGAYTGPIQVDATVAIADDLPDPSADAVVVRRVNMLPHDVILLSKNHVNDAAMGSGIQALFELRKQMGDIPIKDVHVSVRASKVPSHWKNTAQDKRATEDISALKQSPMRQLVGVGRVRSLEIPLVSAEAWKSRRKKP